MTENQEEISAQMEELNRKLLRQQALLDQQSLLLRNQSLLVSSLIENQQKMEVKILALEEHTQQLKRFVRHSKTYQNVLYENQCTLSNHIKNEGTVLRNEILEIKIEINNLKLQQSNFEEALKASHSRRTHPMFESPPIFQTNTEEIKENDF